MRVRRREGTGRAIRAYPMGRSSPACCVKWLALRFVLNLYSHACSVETVYMPESKQRFGPAAVAG